MHQLKLQQRFIKRCFTLCKVFQMPLRSRFVEISASRSRLTVSNTSLAELIIGSFSLNASHGDFVLGTMLANSNWRGEFKTSWRWFEIERKGLHIATVSDTPEVAPRQLGVESGAGDITMWWPPELVRSVVLVQGLAWNALPSSAPTCMHKLMRTTRCQPGKWQKTTNVKEPQI